LVVPLFPPPPTVRVLMVLMELGGFERRAAAQ
jgi:hypothetical protein